MLIYPRVKDVTKLKKGNWDHVILQPVQFHGHVIRKLSDWCSVVPDISIDAELPSLKVQLGPGDYNAILSLMNSLSDGRSTVTKRVGGGEGGEGGEEVGEEGEKKEKALNIKQRKASCDINDGASNSCVKLFLKFHMNEVS